MNPRTGLAIACLLFPAPALAQEPRAEEVRELRRKVEATLVDELTRRWFPDLLTSMAPAAGSIRLSAETGHRCPTTAGRWFIRRG